MKCIDEEIPFEIPQGWEWEKLGNIASICGGKRIPVGQSLTTVNTGHKYIRVTDMKNHSVNSNDIHYITEDIYQKSKLIIFPKKTYILLSQVQLDILVKYQKNLTMQI